MKFYIKDLFSKYDQISRKLQNFTEEIINGKLHILWRAEFYSTRWKEDHKHRIWKNNIMKNKNFWTMKFTFTK